MPKINHTINLPGFRVKKTEGFNPIYFYIEYRRKPKCPHCESKSLRKKDKVTKTIKSETIGLRNSFLVFDAFKFQCKSCSKYFMQRFEGILPWQRSTENFKKQIFKLHADGISRKNIANNVKLSDATIARWYDYVYELKYKMRFNLICPAILGIDEHSFSRKHKYSTTFCDLKSRKVFDVALGRSSTELSGFMDKLIGRNKVKIVCMDLL